MIVPGCQVPNFKQPVQVGPEPQALAFSLICLRQAAAAAAAATDCEAAWARVTARPRHERFGKIPVARALTVAIRTDSADVSGSTSHVTSASSVPNPAAFPHDPHKTRTLQLQIAIHSFIVVVEWIQEWIRSYILPWPYGTRSRRIDVFCRFLVIWNVELQPPFESPLQGHRRTIERERKYVIHHRQCYLRRIINMYYACVCVCVRVCVCVCVCV